MGRPTKLTPAVQQKIVDAISAGNFLEAAAGYAGVDYATMRRWIIDGQAGRPKFREFYDAVTHAEHQAEVLMVAQWKSQMPGDWRAIRDFMDRRYSARWRKVEVQEISGPDGGPIEVASVPSLTEDQRARRVAALIERARNRPVESLPAGQPHLDPPAGSPNGRVAH